MRIGKRRRAPAEPPPPPPARPNPPPAAAAPAPQPAGEVVLPLARRPVVRTGIYSWAFVGIGLLVVGVGYVVGQLSIVVVPLILALFPAAVLMPVSDRLKRRLPDALAALITLVGFLALLIGLVSLLAPAVAAQLDGLAQAAREGFQAVQSFLERGAFGLQPVRLESLVQRAREQVLQAEGLGANVAGAVRAVVEGVAGLIFGLVALFFYLKDGPTIAHWLGELFPRPVRSDAAHIGGQAWQTIGAYIRGQAIIAFVDATLIGLGIFLLGVPLLLPLVSLIFVGGLFPIVGAVIAGALAVLVALATVGLAKALILLGIIIAVQQVEGDVLAPIVLGKATQLHPLATLAALTAGAVLLGVLGAFLAIPIAASATRAVGYLRQRVPG